MADKAIAIMKDETEHIVYGKDFDPEKYKDAKLVCAGEINGKQCRVPVEAVEAPKGGYYFRAIKNYGNNHMAYCPYDEHGDYRVVKNLDEHGKGTTISKLYEKLIKETGGKKDNKDNEEKDKDTSRNASDDDQECIDEKKEVQKKKPPKDPKELFEAFSMLNVNGYFGNDQCRVRDHVICERTAVWYYKHGIPEDTIMLVVGKRTHNDNFEKVLKINRDLITLEDACLEGKNVERLFYILKVRQNDLKKIKNLIFDNSPSRFLILSKWIKYEAAGERYYISESLTIKQVQRVDVNFIKQWNEIAEEA